MADKPSRALVLYGDGLARFIDPSHNHLHSLASKASCGFLSLPNAPPSESEDERVVREFAVLLDACEAHLDKSGNTAKMPTIDERFMGMKAAIITNNPSLKAFGAKIGCSVLEFDDLMKNLPCLAELPADVVASKLLNLLGFKEGKTLEISEYDLIFVHIGDGEKVNSERNKAVADDTVYVNALVGGIVQIAQPGSEISSRLHLSLVMSYGNVPEDNDPKLSVLINKDEKNSDLSVLFPRQSYTVRGENPRKDVRHHCPMLIAQWQYGVTRKDMAEAFSFKDFKEVWLTLETLFSAHSQACIVQTRSQLTNLKKGSQKIAEYFCKAQNLAHAMAAANQPIQDSKLVSYILASLGADYDSLVTSVTTRSDSVKLNDLYGYLLSHEIRLDQHQTEIDISIPTANTVQRQPSSHPK